MLYSVLLKKKDFFLIDINSHKKTKTNNSFVQLSISSDSPILCVAFTLKSIFTCKKVYLLVGNFLHFVHW